MGRKILTTINLTHDNYDSCRAYGIAFAIDRATMMLYRVLLRDGIDIHPGLTTPRQAIRRGNGHRIQIRLHDNVWDYCEAKRVVKSVYVNYALDFARQHNLL